MAEETLLSRSPEGLDALRESLKAVDEPVPNLEPYEKAVADLMANIWTLTREIEGRNLTDNAPMSLENGCTAMLECVERFETQVTEEGLI